MSLSSGTWSGPFGYGGPYGYQEDSDSGLKLLGHRYYDPSIGRFLTRDKAYDGRNWYGYCDNSPLVLTDPSGLKEILGFDFTLEGIGHGLMTGLAGVVSSVSCGLWDGGRWKNEIGFGESQFITDIGTAPLQFVESGGVGTVLKVSSKAIGLAGKIEKGAKALQSIGKFKWLQNGEHIASISGIKKYRVPDIFTRHTIGEVKNVKRLAYTSQIRDYEAYARDKGLKFYLFVREGTELTGPLQDAVDLGRIILRRRF